MAELTLTRYISIEFITHTKNTLLEKPCLGKSL
jgi:hypothetical protein